MKMKQHFFHIYIIVFIIIVNVFSKSFPRAEPIPNNSTEVVKTETGQTTPTNTNLNEVTQTQIQTQIGTPEPTNTEGNTDVQNDNSDANNKEPKKEKSHVDSAYGSVDIEFIPRDPEDNRKIHMIIYFSSIAAVIVLVCVIHSLILIRPKIIEKKANKRKLKHLKNKKNKQGSISNISSSEGATYNKGKNPEEKLNEDSPSASMEYTSYNASSTDCIINLDKNSSKISINRRKSGESETFKKKL